MKCNTDLTPDEVTFNTLLDGCARYGLYERGMQVLEETTKGMRKVTRKTKRSNIKATNWFLALGSMDPYLFWHNFVCEVCLTRKSEITSNISQDVMAG